MQYLRVRNFERYQHYKDRRPPWIKLYKDLWNTPEFFELSEKTRYFLLGIFVIASQNDNKFPNNERWLRRELATTKPIPIQQLIDLKWLESADEICQQDASKMLVLPRDRNTEVQKKTPCSPPKGTKSKTEIPEQFPVTDLDREWAAKNRITVSLELETEALRDWAKSKGVRRLDWNATRRNWWREAQRRQAKGSYANKTKTDRNAEAARRLLSRLDSEDRSSGLNGNLGSNSGRLLGTTAPIEWIGDAGSGRKND